VKKESTSFFEKKEAKKLLLQILSASCEMNKSFLLLFFKKEVLASMVQGQRRLGL